ncbi:TonB-dependent hemoglobin/transferrin/lactoferrin family receptor [Silanimonas sp.]|jgi:hemoglobin/transferrin/lactoferrin receptor protein|uniref:TonB-dependent hemoglobin/transferrin/lactoferrin family receptor n=1 Tax=Silanimonas sp. TaxID=1929290 RepID=UPI0037C6577B
MRPRCLAVAVGLALSAPLYPSTVAASPSPAPEPATLDAVIVVATREASAMADVPATVGVVPRLEIERTQAQDLRELFRYEPSVTVVGGYGRFGLGDVRIRGLGGNRVQLQVDGVNVADAFSIGSFANADRDAVDVAILKQAEVLRGPASALYGSDALGGTVRFVTLDPDDLLEGDDGFSGRVRAGAASVDDSPRVGVTLAARGGDWSWLVHAQVRDGDEAENFGTNEALDATRTAANPSDQQQRALLGKLLYDLGGGDRLRLTLDAGETDAATSVISARADTVVFGQRVRVQSLDADDRKTRARVSLDGLHGLDIAAADTLRWQWHRQDSTTEQRTYENRATIVGTAVVNPTRRERLFDFFQREDGLELSAEKSLGDVGLLYGLQLTETTLRQKRDGRSINLTTGAVSGTIFPDVFPVRDFPVSRTREWGFFAQADVPLLDGDLRLVPALRYDDYRLDPSLDAIFAADNPGFVPVGLDAQRWSPKLGLVWSFTDAVSLYANAAAGFRAPPYDDANLGFTNVASGYAALPNPDLKPETSRGVDVGLRGDHGPWQWTVTAHATRYRDFIDSRRNVGIDPTTGLLLFQSVNRSRVDTWGAEASARLAFDDIGWRGGYLRFAASRTRGVDRTADAWLASIDPLRAVLGVGWRGEVAGLELVASAAARQHDVSGTGAFIAPGHALLDLIADWELSSAWRLEAAVFNLADRRVWDATDTAGVSASSTLLDRFTRAGRNARLTVTASF